MSITQQSLFVCDYSECNKHFSTKYNLQRHIQSCHLLIKNFVCDICGMKLVSKQTKLEHMFIHTGEKPYKCDVPDCTKRYRQTSQLSIHKKKHWRRLHSAINLHPVCQARADLQKYVKLPLAYELKMVI